MKLSTLLTPLMASAAVAQGTTSPYTDPKSGITFQYYTDSSTGWFFGINIPAGSTTDFIATLGAKGTGWAGVSLGGAMKNKLLVVTWPNDQALVGSFRKIAQYGPPPEATGTWSLAPIANGTYVNSTHFTHTFTCKNCIQTDNTTFKATDATAQLGLAFNAAAPTTKSSSSSALTKHTKSGQFTVNLAAARGGSSPLAEPKVFRA